MPVLYTTIERAANDDIEEFDVAVEFEARMTSRGYRATRYEPGAGPEYDVEFTEARFSRPQFAPGELTAIEVSTLRTWFDANYDRAIEAANDDEGGY